MDAESTSLLCLLQRKTKTFWVTWGTCPLGNQAISALRDLKNRTPMHAFKNIWLIAYFACNTVLGPGKSQRSCVRGSPT